MGAGAPPTGRTAVRSRERGPVPRTAATRLALALWPPDRLLTRPDPSAISTIRFGLGLTDEPPRDLDSPAFAPLARRRLGSRGGPDGLFERTRASLAGLASVLAGLASAGIPVMPLKGLAMILFVYRDMGVRPMADLDLLVPPERFLEARETLEGLGFAPRLQDPRGLATAPGHVDHSVALRRPGGLEIDLHYFALDECRWPGADDGLWERSEERRVLGAGIRVPSPTDLLLHLLGHGYRVSRGAPRWAADAGAVLLDRPEAVDWPLLVAEARRRRMVLPLAATLRCLRDDLGIAIPAEPLARLDESPVAAWEPFDFWVRSSTGGRTERLFLALADYLRLATARGDRPGLAGFVRYLTVRWGVDGSLAREIARRACDVLAGRPARRPADPG